MLGAPARTAASAALGIGLVLLLVSQPAAAQAVGTLQAASVSSDDEEAVALPTWAGDLAFVSGNALLGGLAAGLLRSVRGGSFWTGFRDGALGGMVAYAGRRVAVQRFDGAGFLGREVAAVGASFVRNAARGDRILDEVVLPLWVARLYLRGGPSQSGQRTQLKLDVPTVVATAYLGFRGGTELDWSATLSAGTPVFFQRERFAEGGWFGSQAAGAIWLRGNPNDPFPDVAEDAVFAHERVHVLQYDFSFMSWGESIDGLVSDRLPGGPWIDRHLDLGVHIGAWGLANALVRHDQRPWEHEANFLSEVGTATSTRPRPVH